MIRFKYTKFQAQKDYQIKNKSCKTKALEV